MNFKTIRSVQKIIKIITVGLLTTFCLVVRAQDTTTLTIAMDGTVKVTDLCPNPRDAVAYSSIQAAVNCAVAGDTLAIAPGTYYDNITIDKNLTLQGADTANTIVDGGMTGRVFTIENDINVSLADLTISGGEAETGGGIFTDTGTIVVERSNITGNKATLGGGGIYSHNGKVSISDSTISNNDTSIASNNKSPADTAGGGLYIFSGQATIDNSILTGNSATAQTCATSRASARGGGIYTQSGSIVITNGSITGNSVSATSCNTDIATIAEGDGIYSVSGLVTINSSQMVDSVASGSSNLFNGDSAPSVANSQSEPTQQPTTSTAVAHATPTIQPTSSSDSTSAQGDAQIAIDWMQTLMNAVKDEKYSPPVASRIFAYTGITLYQAILPNMPNRRSLVGQLNALPAMPTPEAGLTYDWSLVANTALRSVATQLFEGASQTTLDSFTALRDSIELARGETVPVNVFNRSRVFGDALGKAILDWASADNYKATRNLAYNLPVGNPAFWVPLEGQKPTEPYWGDLRTFALPLASYCDIPMGIEFSTDTTSAFYNQANDVKSMVTNLTSDERAITLFWADSAAETSTPPGHWLSIENQMVRQLKLSLNQAAEMYALTGVSMADAFIAAWKTKYRIQLIRPVTYIQTYIDSNWQTVLKTPAFPEYPSGHSVVSGAAATVLTHLFGDISFEDTSHLDMGLPTRSFTSFQQAANEAALSRVYAGIHYRFSIENGLKQGDCVGQHVLDSIHLKQ